MADDNKFVDEMISYVEFADNANERTPCVLVLDCSGSMRGEPIKQLNAGLKALEKELKEDIDASSRVQLLIIKAFGKDEAVISSDWIDAMNFTAPTMEAGGLTPLGKAMELALNGDFNRLAVIKDGRLSSVPLEEVVGNNKVIGAVSGNTPESNIRRVTMDHDLVKTARHIGINLGD